jgi:hypothetical protein
MQNDTETPAETTDTGSDIGTSDTPAEKAKRERETWPIRMLVLDRGGLLRIVPDAGPFDDARAAKRWVRQNGDEGKTYLPAKWPAQAHKVPSRDVEDVEFGAS